MEHSHSHLCELGSKQNRDIILIHVELLLVSYYKTLPIGLQQVAKTI